MLHQGGYDQLNRAVEQQVREVASAHGREVDVEYVRSDSGATVAGAGRLTRIATVLGYLAVVVMALVRGPLARTLRLGLTRMTALIGLGLLTGTVLAGLGGVPGADWRTALLLAAGFCVAAVVTQALNAVGGIGGIAIAAALFLALEAPLLLETDPLLLPDPWRTVSAWTPVGATMHALTADVVHDGAGLGRPVAVMVTWSVVAMLAALVARRGRLGSRDGTRTADEPLTLGWRVRVLVTVVPLASTMLVLTALVPGDVVAESAPMASRATESRCLRTGSVEGVADLNRVLGRLRGSPEFNGGDAGASTLLQDGRRVLVFGDTLRVVDGEQRFVRNSMLVLEQHCLDVILPAGGGALIPDRGTGDDAVGYWPMGVETVERDGYDLLLVTAQRVRATGSGPFDFENLGPALAVFVVPLGGTPQVIGVQDVGEDSADTERPAWGAATAFHDGWLMLYGTARPDDPGIFGFALHLARVRPDDLMDPSMWEFWDGTGWTAEADSAVALVPAVGGVSQTLSVFEQDGTWHALSKRDDFLGDEVTVWSAPDPWGPFDSGQPVADLPSDDADGDLRYMPLAHPDLFPRPGTVVVSYSRNSTDLGKVLEDPLLYRPRFIRVALPVP